MVGGGYLFQTRAIQNMKHGSRVKTVILRGAGVDKTFRKGGVTVKY